MIIQESMTYGDIASTLLSIVSIIVSTMVAYHIYRLSKQLSNSDRLNHKSKIKSIADEHIYNIRKNKLNSEVYIVNINRYFKDYPDNKEKLVSGYSHISAEIKNTTYDGIEFFAEMPVGVYKRKDKFYFSGDKSEKVFNVYPVGLIPYASIEYIDLDGDEFSFKPLFFCHFNGKKLFRIWKRFIFIIFPYHEYRYYRKSESYDDTDPIWMNYQLIEEKIYN